jgi:hypothetical protein
MWYRPLGKAGRSGAELSRRSTDVVAFLSKSADELPLGPCLIIGISEDAARLRIEKPADFPTSPFCSCRHAAGAFDDVA